MSNKEYTYDIGKYTIGVDTNGEDGIGMTVAIIKNGEINFLGNCYGENARCLDLLIKENQELKSQLKGTTHCYDEEEHRKLKKQLENCYCNRTDCSGRIKDSKVYDRLVQKVETQQQEFIKWLEDEIKHLEHSRYVSFNEFGEHKLMFYKEVLQKYKSIIGGEDENKTTI